MDIVTTPIKVATVAVERVWDALEVLLFGKQRYGAMLANSTDNIDNEKYLKKSRDNYADTRTLMKGLNDQKENLINSFNNMDENDPEDRQVLEKSANAFNSLAEALEKATTPLSDMSAKELNDKIKECDELFKNEIMKLQNDMAYGVKEFNSADISRAFKQHFNKENGFEDKFSFDKCQIYQDNENTYFAYMNNFYRIKVSNEFQTDMTDKDISFVPVKKSEITQSKKINISGKDIPANVRDMLNNYLIQQEEQGDIILKSSIENKIDDTKDKINSLKGLSEAMTQRDKVIINKKDRSRLCFFSKTDSFEFQHNEQCVSFQRNANEIKVVYYPQGVLESRDENNNGFKRASDDLQGIEIINANLFDKSKSRIRPEFFKLYDSGETLLSHPTIKGCLKAEFDIDIDDKVKQYHLSTDSVPKKQSTSKYTQNTNQQQQYSYNNLEDFEVNDTSKNIKNIPPVDYPLPEIDYPLPEPPVDYPAPEYIAPEKPKEQRVER